MVLPVCGSVFLGFLAFFGFSEGLIPNPLIKNLCFTSYCEI